MHYQTDRIAWLVIVMLSSSCRLSPPEDPVADTRTVEPSEISFEISCSDSSQRAFNRAVTLLHSFEYPETERLFAELVDQEPSCAMAYWGAAMSLWHPLWAPPSEQDLATGAALLEATETLDATPRERAYIAALRRFFSSTDRDTHRQRALAYAEAMSQVYAGYLDDSEAAVFYALALLAVADPHDKSYARQYQAAALLHWVGESQPTHPGVLHYLIHSYDYPGLAHLGLRAAKTYAAAAPDSAHAQHMPSHIFTRLGLWDQSLASNRDSTRSAAAYTVRAQLSGHYDEGLHSMDYLMYAMLQTARDEEARQLLATLASIHRTEPENFKVAYTFAAAPARYALERRAWEEASTLELREDFPWQDFGWARSIHYFARGIGAARAGRADAASAEAEKIEELLQALPASTLPYWREEVQVHLDSVRSWILFRNGDVTSALQLAEAAAEREDAVDKHPVTPGEVLPARELYADMLLESGRPAAAFEQYDRVLRASPNRLNALLGAARAAARSGDSAAGDAYLARARAQTKSGSSDRVDLSRDFGP